MMARRVRSRPTRPKRDDGSSDALGLALIAPAAIGLALVIVFVGRGVDSRATVQSAADSAAQAAARERTPAAAQLAAGRVASSMLVDESSCSSPSVLVDTTAFRPGGQVAVSISCSVSAAGLELISPPDLGPTSATAFATIDPFRAAGEQP